MQNYINRLIRAAKLDPKLYEEVEADKTAMGASIGTVVLASIAAGLGSGLKFGIVGLLQGAVIGLLSWAVWALLTYFIGTKIFPESETKSDINELLRTIGFSSAPGILRIIGIIPVLRSFIFAVSSVWMLIAMVIAVRQALDYKSTGRAIIVCLIGWMVQVAILALFVPFFN